MLRNYNTFRTSVGSITIISELLVVRSAASNLCRNGMANNRTPKTNFQKLSFQNTLSFLRKVSHKTSSEILLVSNGFCLKSMWQLLQKLEMCIFPWFCQIVILWTQPKISDDWLKIVKNFREVFCRFEFFLPI